MLASTPDGSLIAASLLGGRILIAALFLIEGISKIGIYAAAGTYMARFGVPAALLPLVIASEIGLGFALLFGWQTRWVALALAGFCILAALLFHRNFGNQNEFLHFQKDLAIAGGLLALFACGGGKWSMDQRSGA